MDTERIYQGEDRQWYFNVRGNQTMGPFTSYSEAEGALAAHVGACKRRLDFSSLLPEFLGPLKARRRTQAQPRHS